MMIEELPKTPKRAERYRWAYVPAETLKGLKQKYLVQKINIESGIVYESKHTYTLEEAKHICKEYGDFPMKKKTKTTLAGLVAGGRVRKPKKEV